jgi:hypothetical protein
MKALYHARVILALVRLASLALALGVNPTIANRILDYVYRAVTPAALTGPIKASLHTADPGTTGANEAVGGSYARQTAGYNAAAAAAIALAAALNFTGMAAGTYTHYGLWDSAGSPVFLQGSALAVSKTVGAGDTVQITAAPSGLTG